MKKLLQRLVPTIIKALLGIFIPDPNLFSETWVDVANCLGDTFNGFEDKDDIVKGADYQLDKIARKISNYLASIFELEGTELSEYQQEKVIEVALRALNNAQKSSFLIENELDAANISKKIISNYGYLTKDFDKVELDFYKHLILALCQVLVKISTRLSDFEVTAFATILQSDGVLIQKVDQCLSELINLREQVIESNPSLKTQRFELQYRQLVVQELDKLNLFGIDDWGSKQSYSLRIAYIPLSIRQRGIKENDFHHESVTPEKILSSNDRILIIGDAGSGKTTLLHWISVCAAAGKFPDELNSWNGKLPFFIPLRFYANRKLPVPEEFPEWLAANILGEMPHGWVHDIIRANKAIIMLDGVDEITDQDTFYTWLQKLTTIFSNCIYIVTSRPANISTGWLDREKFREVDVLQMKVPQIFDFVLHWYSALEQASFFTSKNFDIKEKSSKLQETLKRNKSLQNLATNPLLCAVICALNYKDPENVPNNRIDLYQKCCDMLLGKRDDAKGVNINIRGFERQHKYILLNDIAYYMFRNGEAEIDLAKALERINTKIKNLQGLSPDVDGEQILKLLIGRSGLIRQPVLGRVDFIHKTFQEYLAAIEATNESDFGLIADNAHKPSWREFIILAAGVARPKEANQLILELIEKGERDNSNKHALQLLAVACFEMLIEVFPEVKERIDGCLKELVPPKDFLEARGIASAGDLAVPHLIKYNNYENEEIKNYCILSLALIETELALMALQEFDSGDNDSILVRLWTERFSYKKEYAELFLSKYDSLQLTSLNGVNYLTNVKTIIFKGTNTPSNFAILEQVPQLTIIEFPETENLTVNSLEGIKFVKNIKDIVFVGTDVPTDISVLSNLKGLKSIRFMDIDSLKLNNLEGIEFVLGIKHIIYATKITNLRFDGLDNRNLQERVLGLRMICDTIYHRLHRLSLEDVESIRVIETDGTSEGLSHVFRL